jgi:predicted MPP superfamily phosphohydrolase
VKEKLLGDKTMKHLSIRNEALKKIFSVTTNHSHHLQNYINMKANLTSFVLLVIIISTSCKREQLPVGKGFPIQNNFHLKIAVVSDIHYMDPSLLKNHANTGAAFNAYLDADPKLIEFSDPIFRNVVAQIKSEKPDILLIPGDLTKDGERVSHRSVVQLIKQISDAQIKVFVVPGNHDINNPEAVTYDGDNASPTPSISASEFSNIYSDYGYGNAIARDPNSLSYVAEPYPSLWILGIDDCEYYDNKNIAIVAGKIKPETMKWALAWIAEAKRRHIMIFGMMHHNLIEHYVGQTQLDPGYVTDNGPAEADQFMSAGMSVIFTGHYHANDITERITGNNQLYDIETGSLVTAPIPFRIISMNNNEFDITTKYITSIDAKLPGGLDFPTYSNLFLSQHLDGYFSYFLANPPFSLPDPYIAEGAPLFRNAIMAHFAGDEMITPAEQAADDSLGQLSPLISGALSSLWTDINTPDNNLHLKFTAP